MTIYDRSGVIGMNEVDTLKQELCYRKILQKIGVVPEAIERIMKTVDVSGIDISKEALLTEEARSEWKDFIPLRLR